MKARLRESLIDLIQLQKWQYTKIVRIRISCQSVKRVCGVAQDYDFYLADGTGTAIGSGTFKIDGTDGSAKTLPWTLNNYMLVSSAKYPSRVRIYCVRKLKSGIND